MPDKPLKKLIAGFEEFRKEKYELNPEHMAELVEKGQFPDSLVIACSDSRSCPENVFGVEEGEIFVGRHIAALIPPYDGADENDTVTASIEYAVAHLKVKHIIVVGHTHCGGIAGLAKDMKEGAVGHWIQRAHEIKELVENKQDITSSESDVIKAMERESIVWSLNNLRSYPCVKKATENGDLQIHGWQFDMKDGRLLEYDIKTKTFEVIAGDTSKRTNRTTNKKNGSSGPNSH